MNWKNTTQLAEGVHAVGIRDWNRRLFDALISLPKGTTYNSYLIIGNNKKALIDTVNPGFEKEWEERIAQKTDPAEIDYVIMNHAEPDHAGAIPYILSINKKAKLVTSLQGVKMAQVFYDVSPERIIPVKDQETLRPRRQNSALHRGTHASLARNHVHLPARRQNPVSLRLLRLPRSKRSVRRRSRRPPS